MFNLRIPVVSPTAGKNNDGVLIGEVRESLLTASLTDVHFASNIFAIRKDVLTGGGFTFTDISSEAVSEVANSFEPWGNTSQMSAGDELLVACDNTIRELYFDIDTPGAWTGGNMEIRYSTNGTTANATIQNLNDGTNGFRNVDGVYRVSFTVPTDLVSFSPVPGDITSRRWIVIRPSAVTTITTAPRLRRLYVVHDAAAVTYTNLTATMNGDTAIAPTGLPNTFFPVIGSLTYHVFGNPAYGLEYYLFRRTDPAITVTWEYLADDNTYKPIQNFVDPSSNQSTGPATTTTPPTRHSLRWTIPSDWSQKTLTLPITGGGNQSFTGFFIRSRIATVTSLGPIQTALLRSRARQFGAANAYGIYFPSQRIFRAVTYSPVGTPPTQNTVVTFTSANTGTSSSITFPLNVRESGELTSQRLDLNFTIPAEQSMIVSCMSGGTIIDAPLHLLE